jgi:hypothetical protein
MRTFGIVVRCAVLGAAATSLSACAGGMIPGQIYSEQGKVLEFQIEKARRTGAVAAFDPQNGRALRRQLCRHPRSRWRIVGNGVFGRKCRRDELWIRIEYCECHGLSDGR